jgi:hypothetical protein
VLKGTFLATLYYRLNTVCLARPDSLNVAVDAGSLERAERELRGAVGFTLA